jgi:hypothetical protein
MAPGKKLPKTVAQLLARVCQEKPDKLGSDG